MNFTFDGPVTVLPAAPEDACDAGDAALGTELTENSGPDGFEAAPDDTICDFDAPDGPSPALTGFDAAGAFATAAGDATVRSDAAAAGHTAFRPAAGAFSTGTTGALGFPCGVAGRAVGSEALAGAGSDKAATGLTGAAIQTTIDINTVMPE